MQRGAPVGHRHGRLAAGHRDPPRIEIIEPALRVRRPYHRGHEIGDLAHVTGAFVRFVFRFEPQAAALQPAHGRLREHRETVALGRGETLRTRHPVDDAQRPERRPFGSDQRSTRVEPDVLIAGNERVVGKYRIARGIGHFADLAPQHRVGAEAHAARGLALLDALPGEEQLAVALDETDQRHRRFAQLGGEPDDRLQLGVVFEQLETVSR